MSPSVSVPEIKREMYKTVNVYKLRLAVNAGTTQHNMNAKAINLFKRTLRYDTVVLRVLYLG